MALPVVTEKTLETVNQIFEGYSVENVYETFFETLKEENPGLGLIIEAQISSDDPARVSRGAGMIAVYQMLRVQDITNSVSGLEI